MPKYTQTEFLRALEGDTPQPDTIIAAGQAVAQVVEPPIPGMGDTSLTPYNRTSILLQILSFQMSVEDLTAWLNEHAVDLEVYQLAHSAREIRDTAAALNVPNGNFYPLVASVAADMARNANHSASIALDSADEAKRVATAEIMQTYGDAAVTALRNCLEEIRMAVKDMPNGGDRITQSCEYVLSHLGTNSSPSTPVIPDAPTDGPATEGFKDLFKKQTPEQELEWLVKDLGWSVNNFLSEQKEFKSEMAFHLVNKTETLSDIKKGHSAMLLHAKYADGFDNYIGHGLVAQAVRNATSVYGQWITKYGLRLKMAVDDDKASIYIDRDDEDAWKTAMSEGAQESAFISRRDLNSI